MSKVLRITLLNFCITLHWSVIVVAAEVEQQTPEQRYGTAVRLLSRDNEHPNPVRARELLEINDQLGHSVSSILLAKLLTKGVDGQQDVLRALKILHGLAHKGIACAGIELGDMYLYGLAVTQDDDQAFQYYVRAARCKDFFAQIEQPQNPTLKADQRRAELLQKAAERVRHGGQGVPDTRDEQRKEAVLQLPVATPKNVAPAAIEKQQDVERVKESLKAGIEFFRSGKYKEAIEELEDVAESQPDSLAEVALYLAKALVKNDPNNGYRRANRYYRRYFEECEKLNLVKNVEALYDYGMLVHAGHQARGDDTSAEFYFEAASLQGHEEATYELALIALAKGDPESHHKGIACLKKLPKEHVRANVQLALAHLQKKLSVDDESSQRIFEGLLKIAQKDKQNYAIVRACVTWLIEGRSVARARIADIEKLVANLEDDSVTSLKMRPEALKEIHSDMANYYVSTKQYAEAYRYFRRLEDISVEGDRYFLSARLNLAYGFVMWGFAPNDKEKKDPTWLDAYMKHRPKQDHKLFITDEKLGDAMLSASQKFERVAPENAMTLLQHAYGLGRGGYEYLCLLLREGKNDLARDVLSHVLPVSEIDYAKALIDRGTLKTTNMPENVVNIAWLVAGHYRAFAKDSSESSQYPFYLACAALAGRDEAFYELGSHIMEGRHGFKKNAVLAVKWLNKVPKNLEMRPKALVLLGTYYLERENYQAAIEKYLEACALEHFSEQNIENLQDAFIKLRKSGNVSEANKVCDAIIKLFHRFPNNSRIQAVKCHKANTLLSQKSTRPSDDVILDLLKGVDSHEAKMVKARIHINNEKFEQAEPLITAFIEAIGSSSEYIEESLLMQGYVFLKNRKYKQAFNSFQRASRKDYPIAQLNVALMHFLWNDSKYDDTEAMRRLVDVVTDEFPLPEILSHDFVFQPFFFASIGSQKYFATAQKIKDVIGQFDLLAKKETEGGKLIELSGQLAPLIAWSVENLEKAAVKIKQLSAERKKALQQESTKKKKNQPGLDEINRSPEQFDAILADMQKAQELLTADST